MSLDNNFITSDEYHLVRLHKHPLAIPGACKSVFLNLLQWKFIKENEEEDMAIIIKQAKRIRHSS